MVIKMTLLPRHSTESTLLRIKFSTFTPRAVPVSRRPQLTRIIEDGKEMSMDSSNMGIKVVTEEVDRHSRKLQKEEDLVD